MDRALRQCRSQCGQSSLSRYGILNVILQDAAMAFGAPTNFLGALSCPFELALK